MLLIVTLCSAKQGKLRSGVEAKRHGRRHHDEAAKRHGAKRHGRRQHEDAGAAQPGKKVEAKLEQRTAAISQENVDPSADMSGKQLLKLVRQEARDDDEDQEQTQEQDEEQDEQQQQESMADTKQDAQAQASEAGSETYESDAPAAESADEECVPCVSGAECYAGCRKMTASQRAKLQQRSIQRALRDGVAPFQGHELAAKYNVVPLGADGVMPKGEEFGSLVKHCKSGNCEPLEKTGVKVDGWGFGQSDKSLRGFYRMFPVPQLDPSAKTSVVRQMNQRRGRFAQYNKAGQDGVYTPGATWGANSKFWAHDRSPGAKKLEEQGVRRERGGCARIRGSVRVSGGVCAYLGTRVVVARACLQVRHAHLLACSCTHLRVRHA